MKRDTYKILGVGTHTDKLPDGWIGSYGGYQVKFADGVELRVDRGVRGVVRVYTSLESQDGTTLTLWTD